MQGSLDLLLEGFEDADLLASRRKENLAAARREVASAADSKLLTWWVQLEGRLKWEGGACHLPLHLHHHHSDAVVVPAYFSHKRVVTSGLLGCIASMADGGGGV
jgi:hypothetical protein